MAAVAIEIGVGKRVYRIAGDRVWVQGFGTTGPGQKPHYSWIEVDHGGPSFKEAKTALREAGLCGSGR